MIDDQNKKTHQMIENFNKDNGLIYEAVDGENSALLKASSPLIRRIDSKDKPKEIKPKITDFEIYEVIGMGNFGKVQKAYNKKSKRMCALKVISKESVG